MKKFLSMLAISFVVSGIASAEEISAPEEKIFDDANEIQIEYLEATSSVNATSTITTCTSSKRSPITES